ncbi:MAG: hypothetical protein ACRCX7_14780 [Cetobacterium sp.]|uniref:hypothetical protein n=1 Tax=Cetobacterium sp. TaxID=2071632 RepID=UPI003F375B80
MATLWQKLSGSINFYIREVWDKKLLKSNEELLKDYLSYLDDREGNFEYLDKATFEYIKLDPEEVERIKKAFIERIEKKKLKHSKEIERLKIEEQEKRNKPLATIIQFPKNKSLK